ncbi:GtrA family protein [Paenibacillus sp. TRM 82003]|uniref:GtrA family protein n=1 Tax=Kineococcus sp. TRM81007 TaxID=2925831 RepID=UPI001F5616C6|nr:GtrA family protein [Kineococcus sp. TRM81007]MCI2237301.1 GtrA family protein [Kineococcus sp. TRM81007]MCI3919360.1 GtrA family protein [Paenibacillus sp. TRM 82003]
MPTATRVPPPSTPVVPAPRQRVAAAPAAGADRETGSPLTAPTAPRRSQTRALSRFVVAGLVGNLAHAVVFLLLGAWTPLHVTAVNVSATVVSTLVANEMHRRFTFPGGTGTPWFRGHGVGGAAAVLGLVLSTSALAAWHHLVPGAGALSGLLLVHAVTGLVGLVNFLALRTVLRPGRPGGLR